MMRNSPIEFVVIVESDKIRFALPDGQVLCEKDSVVMLTSDNKIVTYGESVESLQKQVPDVWERTASHTTAHNPFSLAEFQSFWAAFFLEHVAFSVLQDKFKKGSALFREKVAWNIVFPGYDELDQRAKDAFEFYMATPRFVATKRLCINDISRDIQVFLDAQSFLKNFAFFPMLVVFVLLWAFANGVFSPVLLPGQQAALIFLLVMGLCWFASSFLLLLIWKVKYQNILSHEVIMAMLSQDRFGLPKTVINWLFGCEKQV